MSSIKLLLQDSDPHVGDGPGSSSDSDSSHDSQSSGVLTSELSSVEEVMSGSEDLEPFFTSDESEPDSDSDASLPPEPSFINPVQAYFEYANLDPALFTPPNGRDKLLSCFLVFCICSRCCRCCACSISCVIM